jgi:hypothetical protein
MTTPNINWRDRYTTSLDALYLFAENKPADDVNTEAAAIALGIIEEIRLGIAAGLLGPSQRTVSVPLRGGTYSTACTVCPHPRDQHGTGGCTWGHESAALPCACTRTYMDLSPRLASCSACGVPLPDVLPATIDAHAKHCRPDVVRGFRLPDSALRAMAKPSAQQPDLGDSTPEQSDPVYVPKLAVPMRDEQPRRPDGTCSPARADGHEDQDDEFDPCPNHSKEGNLITCPDCARIRTAWRQRRGESEA